MAGRGQGIALVKVVCLLSSLLYVQGDEQCYGPLIEITATSQISQADLAHLFGALAAFGSTPPKNVTQAQALAISKPLDACNDLGDIPKGAVVLVQRGNCSFADKAWRVQQAGGSAMVLYNSNPGCVSMGFDHNSSVADKLTIPSISITLEAGEQLAGLLAQDSSGQAVQVLVKLQLVDMSGLDASSILLWLMAVGTVVGGSMWSGMDHLANKRRRNTREAAPLLQSAPSESEVVDITAKSAVAFVFMASAMLLLLFFFLNRIFFYVLLGLFCFASTQATVMLAASILGECFPHYKSQTMQVPLLGSCSTLMVVVTPICTAMAVVWAVFRNSSWAWVLQDLQGIALMLLVMRTLRLNSVKVACILYPLVFFYDIFWVFISPLLFHGESVMVEVAEGGGAHEVLPMLLRVPRFRHRQLGGYSMLGFGDVILPGLLVAYTRRLDIDLDTKWLKGYFVPTSIGYGAGLILTYVALLFSWFGDQGQPALLYLVPCTLGTVLVLSYLRGELSKMYGSKKYRPIAFNDHDSDSGTNVDEDADIEKAQTSQGRPAQHG